MKEEFVISNATKNNWNKLNISENEIIEKLSKRANKQYSNKNIIPVEYFNNKKNIEIVNNIIAYIHEKNIDIKDAIYCLAMNILSKNEYVEIVLNRVYTGNIYISEIIEEFGVHYLDDILLKFCLPQDEPDILGIIYQSMLKEGNKNKKGSYYTPRSIIKKIVYSAKNTDKILDCCCGTGSFLLEFANVINDPKNLYGFDIDSTACFIAKINLILKYKTKHFRPNIFNLDFLKESEQKLKGIKFDIIATNPPWGAKNKKDYIKIFPEISSKESYSYAIVQAEKYIKDDGTCFFVLPESILNVSTHQDIRKFILKNFAIEEIELLGKAFEGVLTDVVTLKLTKKLQNNINIINKNNVLTVKKSAYEKNINNNFSIYDNKDVEIINKIYSKKYSDLKNSKWGLGIVTGNNAKHISKNTKGEKIYTGKELTPYIIKDSEKYIKFERSKFQQVAPNEIYRADEKLIYKFISKKLVFAYDNQQRLVLNSANILIPNIETHSVKTVMAFLNSTLFQYLYKKIFNELKILRGNLQELPFPKLKKAQKDNIEKLVDKYILTREEKYLYEIDDIVYNIFALNDDEILITK